jgi:hypothetical protein
MIDSDSARESEGSRASREAFRTTADAIIDDLTVRCLAYNVAQKYPGPHQSVLAIATLRRWGDLMNMSDKTIRRAILTWTETVDEHSSPHIA